MEEKVKSSADLDFDVFLGPHWMMIHDSSANICQLVMFSNDFILLLITVFERYILPLPRSV